MKRITPSHPRLKQQREPHQLAHDFLFLISRRGTLMFSLRLRQPYRAKRSTGTKKKKKCFANCLYTEHSLTPSVAWCRLKPTNKSAKFETLKPFFVFVFALTCKRIFIKTHSIGNRCFRSEKCTVLQARPCTFQPARRFFLQAGAVKGLTRWYSVGSKCETIRPPRKREIRRRILNCGSIDSSAGWTCRLSRWREGVICSGDN